MPAFALWLQESPLGEAMRQSLYLYPAAEILHILGFVLLVGPIIALDLRLIGLRRFLAADFLARHLLAIALPGFLLAVPMGLLLFVTEAASLVGNPAFLAKLVLIALAGLNAWTFHAGPGRKLADWRFSTPPRAARIAGLCSILFWICAIAAGRLIAYV
ncbi:MAG: hypothetical protein KIT20_02480 [Alphaproteobacteria bacterium]|nr:hypothetical protein [Alphaproteobacteria bacterium]